MKVYIYPGSFDPVTNGHIDIIERAAKLCDKLVVGVLVNNNKETNFTLSERVEMIRQSVKYIKNIEVESFEGLLVNFVKLKKSTTVIKGLRAVSDFEYEFQMASLNQYLFPEIETLFMMTNINYSYLSSSAVRDIAMLGGQINGLVPDCISNRIVEKFTKEK